MLFKSQTMEKHFYSHKLVQKNIEAKNSKHFLQLDIILTSIQVRDLKSQHIHLEAKHRSSSKDVQLQREEQLPTQRSMSTRIINLQSHRQVQRQCSKRIHWMLRAPIQAAFCKPHT